jgi:hypothetical protein
MVLLSMKNILVQSVIGSLQRTIIQNIVDGNPVFRS